MTTCRPLLQWGEYEQISEEFELSDRRSLRLTYDQGRLDVVTTSRAHEKRNRFIAHLIWILTEELGVEVEDVGGTTQKRKRDLKGVDPTLPLMLAIWQEPSARKS